VAKASHREATEQRQHAEAEHAALRRVATLVARDVPPEDVFQNVTEMILRRPLKPTEIRTVMGVLDRSVPIEFMTGREFGVRVPSGASTNGVGGESAADAAPDTIDSEPIAIKTESTRN